jgi:hypothetical protein
MNGFVSLFMMYNSDQNKYGSLMETMSTSFSLGNNTYPKTIEKALDALSNHKIDKTYFVHTYYALGCPSVEGEKVGVSFKP